MILAASADAQVDWAGGIEVDGAGIVERRDEAAFEVGLILPGVALVAGVHAHTCTGRQAPFARAEAVVGRPTRFGHLHFCEPGAGVRPAVEPDSAGREVGITDPEVPGAVEVTGEHVADSVEREDVAAFALVADVVFPQDGDDTVHPLHEPAVASLAVE